MNSAASDPEALSESTSKAKKVSTRQKRKPAVKESIERKSSHDAANGQERMGKRGPPRKAKK